MSDETPVHKRRKRYRGRNPRKFEERYKELNPEKYPQDAEHIIAKGNTLAGSHRPICVAEILEILNPQPGEVALDATLGYGGHSAVILPKILPGGRLFGVDVDSIELPRTEARMRSMGFDQEAFIARKMSFSAVRGLLYEAGGGFDLIVADLGVSSMQLDNPARGFSHKSEGPLDLRLNPQKGKSASELIATLSAEELERILSENADEPHARIIAQAILASPEPPATTLELADIVQRRIKKIRPSLTEKDLKSTLQRTFMALRIEVNQEFDALERFLSVLPKCMNPGARAAVLTFHSGEDRRVKRAFAKGYQTGLYQKVASNPIRPSAQERRSNPRSSCAKLRWAIRAEL